MSGDDNTMISDEGELDAGLAMLARNRRRKALAFALVFGTGLGVVLWQTRERSACERLAKHACDMAANLRIMHCARTKAALSKDALSEQECEDLRLDLRALAKRLPAAAYTYDEAYKAESGEGFARGLRKPMGQ